jgi:hypothetical protein
MASPGGPSVRAVRRYSVGPMSVTLLRMRELHRRLIRIMKGPTGGLLTSLALAAFLGGVALAAPGPSLEPASEHHGDVAAGAPVEGPIDAGIAIGQGYDAGTSNVRSGVQPPKPMSAGPTSHGSDLRSTAPDRTVDGPAQIGAGGRTTRRPLDPILPRAPTVKVRPTSPINRTEPSGNQGPSGSAGGAHGDPGDAERT